MDPLHIAMLAYTRYRTDARVRRDAEALAARGDRVVCHVLRSQGPASQVVDGVRVSELPFARYRGGSVAIYMIAYGVFLLAASCRLLAARLAGRLDIVHAHNLPDFVVLAALPARLLGARVILDIHDTTPETYAGKFGLRMDHPLIRALCWLERACCRAADQIVVPHELQRQTLVARGVPAERIAVVMNSPDERLFPGRGSASSRRGADFHVIYHGTIAPRHGVDLLVRAVTDLASEIPGIRLTICGEGDHLDAVRRLARAAGGRVAITGQLPLTEMAERLGSADLEVIPLRADAATSLQLPVKALEAIACGVPVACAENRALRHHFGGDSILFFAPEDPAAIRSAILHVFQDPAGAGGRARRAAARLEGYAWRRQKIDYLRIVDALVGRPPAAAVRAMPQVPAVSAPAGAFDGDTHPAG